MAWAAGFFDGEGTIGLQRQSSGNYYLRIAAGQLVRKPLDIMADLWGGSVRSSTEHGKPMFKWTATTNMAERALTEMLPHLVVKDEQASLGLEFHRGRSLRGTTPEQKRENQRRRMVAWRSGQSSPIGRWRVPASEIERGARYMEAIRAARP